jgi:hypothetical protein
MGSGFFCPNVDSSAEYITVKALATRQTPEEIIAALVRKEMAAAI